MSKVYKLKPISNIAIDDYYKVQPMYGGCYSKDELPVFTTNKFYIINMADSENPGTHWVCVLVQPKQCIYFDSFGVQSPVNVLKHMRATGKKCLYSDDTYQSMDSTACGYYCLYVCDQVMIKKRPFMDVTEDFSDDVKSNEQVLNKYFVNFHMIGAGIFQTIKKKAIDLYKGIVHGESDQAPPAVRSMLQNHGSKQIYKMYVCRTPIFKVFDLALNAISQGGWQRFKQANNYDEMFHLYLIIILADGTSIKLEKNQRVSVAYGKYRCGIEVPLNKLLTLHELIHNTEQAVGGKRMWIYTATSNNCQMFCHDILQSNDILTPQSNTYILQDASQIVQHFPHFSKIANTTTKIANIFDSVITGRSVHNINIAG